jgi:hypothetical protein
MEYSWFRELLRHYNTDLHTDWFTHSQESVKERGIAQTATDSRDMPVKSRFREKSKVDRLIG